MNYLCRAGAYPNSVTSTINSLCGMAMSSELSAEMQYKAIITLFELEQAAADFIDYTGLDFEIPNAVRISRYKFTRINEKLIRHTEKNPVTMWRLKEWQNRRLQYRSKTEFNHNFVGECNLKYDIDINERNLYSKPFSN